MSLPKQDTYPEEDLDYTKIMKMRDEIRYLREKLYILQRGTMQDELMVLRAIKLDLEEKLEAARHMDKSVVSKKKKPNFQK